MGHTSATRNRQGFTMVELAVVIVIIAVVAAIGVPRFIRSVERSNATEAFSYLSEVRAAQDRHHERLGRYSLTLDDLDIQYPTPRYFVIGQLSAGGTGSINDSWTLTLNRTSESASHGPYTVVFTEAGYDPTNSSIQSLPEINPATE